MTFFNYHKAREIQRQCQKDDKYWRYKIVVHSIDKCTIEVWDGQILIGYL